MRIYNRGSGQRTAVNGNLLTFSKLVFSALLIAVFMSVVVCPPARANLIYHFTTEPWKKIMTVSGRFTVSDWAEYFFSGDGLWEPCESITDIRFDNAVLEGTQAYIGGIGDERGMFGRNWSAANKLKTVDLRGLTLEKTVLDLSCVFKDNTSIKTVIAGGDFDASHALLMGCMFMGCSSLTSADLDFDTSGSYGMSNMFSGCKELRYVHFGEKFKTSNIVYMAYMFQDCSSLTELDLSGFDTSKTEDFERMFEGCTGLTELDLSSFNTRRASFMHSMFHLCSNLRTIYVGDDWEMEQSNEDIPADYDWAFLGCVNIRGGAGTVYDPNKTDKEYARIDGLNGLKGYLTAKPVDSVDPDAKLAQKVGNNLSKLIGYLPDAQFFSDIKNLSKAKVTGLSAFIDSIKEGSREVIAILTPMRVSEAGVYFMKLNISPKQAERLKGGRDLRYHVKPCASADVRTAEDGESSDNSHGVLVDEDGEKLTGEYDGGDLHVLTYLDKGNTVYVQFITAEPKPKDSHSPSGGCGILAEGSAGFGGLALLGLAALAVKKRR